MKEKKIKVLIITLLTLFTISKLMANNNGIKSANNNFLAKKNTYVINLIESDTTKFRKKLINYFSKNFETNKGQIDLHLSLPWINSFYFQPINENSKENIGFIGISIGIDYYHNESQFLSIKGSHVMDFFFPIPAPFSYDGEMEFMNSTYISFENNHKKNRFTFGYGLNYSINTWNRKDFGKRDDNSAETTIELKDPILTNNKTIGLTTNIYHQIGKHLRVGLIYRPTLLNIKPNIKLNYEHVISFDIAWKIRIKK